MVNSSSKIYAYISGVWVQLDDFYPASGRWGILDNSPVSRMAREGELRFALDNYGGLYSPDGPSALAGWKKGLPLKWVVTYEGIEYIRFRGTIEDIRLPQVPGDKNVYVTALDWLSYAGKYPIVNPAIQTSATADSAISTMLATVPVSPQATSIDTGNFTFPTLFDTVRGNTKMYAELSKLSFSEPGYSYVRHDGADGETLVWEASDYRNGTRTIKTIPVGSDAADVWGWEDGDTIGWENSDEIGIAEQVNATFSDVHISQHIEYGKNIINRFTAKAYPKKQDTQSVLIYETETPLFLGSGESKTFRAFWADPDGKRRINAIPPSGTSTTVSLMRGEQRDGLSFPDETGKVWTEVPDVYIYTVNAKFGDGSIYFDASGPTSLTVPHSDDWEFTGDFTVEWWEYRFGATANQTVLSRDGTDAVPAWLIGESDGTNVTCSFSSDGASFDIANQQSMGTVSANTWTHFAVSRSGSSWYTFKNGTQVSTWTDATAIFTTASSALYMGRNNATYLGGLIDELRITKGEALYTGNFTAPTARFELDGTFYTMNSASDGTGTDLSADLAGSATYGTEGATFTVTNNSTSGGYVTIKTHGYGIYSDSSLETVEEDSASITTYGNQNVNLNQAYQQDIHTGLLEAKKVVELDNEPRTVLNKVRFAANRSGQLMEAFLNVDVGDLVKIVIADQGVDSYYYIQGIEFELKGGGLIFFEWIVKQAWVIEDGLTLMAAEFAGGVATDAINYGHMPDVYGENSSSEMFISCWVYLDTLPATDDMYLFGFPSDEGGLRFYFDTNEIKVYANIFNITPGVWTTTTTPLSTGAWFHVAMYYDTSATGNDAVMYYNGSVQAQTEGSAPSGSPFSKSGVSGVMGNVKTVTIDYDDALDGKLKDCRVYHMDKTSTGHAALALALYNEGAGGTANTEGMVFQAPAVRDEDVTAYTDLTLTTEKVLDAYRGYIGTPNGSPIIRTI